MICIQSCSVAQVSLHAAWGNAGQTSVGRVDTSRSVSAIAPRSDYHTSIVVEIIVTVRKMQLAAYLEDIFKCCPSGHRVNF